MSRKNVEGRVYLLHFDQKIGNQASKYGTAQHYTGRSTSLSPKSRTRSRWEPDMSKIGTGKAEITIGEQGKGAPAGKQAKAQVESKLIQWSADIGEPKPEVAEFELGG